MLAISATLWAVLANRSERASLARPRLAGRLVSSLGGVGESASEIGIGNSNKLPPLPLNLRPAVCSV